MLFVKLTQISRIIFLYTICFFCILTSNRSKNKAHIQSYFYFGPPIDVFTFQRNEQHSNTKILGVHCISRYELFDSCEKTVRHFVMSL